MANVLGELFSEIAGSIRSGLGDIGAMKPGNFPDRIDELVAVMNALANGTGGDGGEEGGTVTGNDKVETGTFDTANTGVGRQYIKHTLGEIPDFVIVYALNMYSSGMDFSKNNFIAAWGVKSDLYSGGVKGSIMNTDSGSTMLGGLDVAIDNESVDLLSARIYCPDDSTIRVGTDKTDYGGQFGENTQYAWIAVSGMKKSVGSSADVRYVTFVSYDGLVEYGKKAVAVGDDCADPIARGVFAKPTREPDMQYNYTFYGWATEPNGGADANWNKAITEDKTVYANFTAVVRYYTVTYYDDDGATVLKTENLSYGSFPNYAPSKTGYTFNGWAPSVVPVTGNASYTATWVEKVDFATLSWTKIRQYCESGQADVFEVGAKKTFTMKQWIGSGYTNSTVTAEIVGINHDELADGSGKAGLTLRLINFKYAPFYWEGEASSAYKQRMWDESEAMKQLQNFITNTSYAVPSELLSAMKKVKKTFYDHADGKYNTVENTVFLPSASELGFSSIYPDEGDCYELFSDGKDVNGAYTELVPNSTNAGTTVQTWTRTKPDLTSGKVYVIGKDGKLYQLNQGGSTLTYMFGYICI